MGNRNSDSRKSRNAGRDRSQRSGVREQNGRQRSGSVRAQSGRQRSSSVRVQNGSFQSGDSKCHVSYMCGGCRYVDVPYEQQLEKKQRYMEGLLGEFGRVDMIIGMDNPHYYRNKVTAAFRRLKSGEVISGIYEEGTHNVIPVESCFVEDRKATAIARSFAKLIKSFKLQLYNEDTGTGLIRHLQIRIGRATGQIMVIIVTASPMFPSKKNLAKALLAEHPDITTIVQNINDRKTTMVIGGRNQTIYGKGYIEDVLCGKTFRISPGSFYQVNPVQTEVLYSKAIKYADLKKKETVVDAYCGIGTIGIAASDRAKRVIGVELSGAAVRDARRNVHVNKLDNVEIYEGDAGKFMVNMADEGEKVDVVFMDPPRSGSTVEFMSSVIALSPKRMVYISCGPESLARDLRYMTTHGYRVIKMTPIDMFPLTEGVETCVLLTKSRAVVDA